MLFVFSMKKVTMPTRNLAAAVALLASMLAIAACGSSSSGGGKNVALVAYSTPKGAYEALIPAFQATPEGKGVSFSQSYGGSGEQSRAVTNGQHADVVNFSLEPDVERL
ncbi:MAG TPA: substrate-binding domain-containing protein, partial [Solirubrobacteraceae bacterium]